MTNTVAETPPLTAQKPAVQSAVNRWRWIVTLSCGCPAGVEQVPEEMTCPRCGVTKRVRFAIPVFAEEAEKHEETTPA